MSDTDWALTIEQACYVIAEASWPHENLQHRMSWQHKIATDPELGRKELERARIRTHEKLAWIDRAVQVLGLEGASDAAV